MSRASSPFDSAGFTYQDFIVTKVHPIPELQSVLRELVHVPTGASIMHIANEDSENLFCLSFQTLPDSSDGAAHILEHTVLCGSEKYPVKDPFFAMTRRSLNTFMNALTGSDFTCYPASSQVPQDFYNLLEVYLDAVFHPLLNQLNFLQEGHRLEFATPDDPLSPLQYKGIVYNEMKGAMSSPSARLGETINTCLFPDLSYGFNSGGDPKVIPQLTYQELCEFHRKFYHPSRCLFFFYGNIPLEQHLDFIASKALKNVQKVLPIAPLKKQPRFTKPKRIIQSYPISPDEETKDKTYISFGWLTCHILEQEDCLALNILDIILMDTDASPLKMALLKSGLCKQASSYTENDISEVPFILNLKGCNPASADDAEELVKTTLKTIAKNGIPQKMIDNAIHQLEFHRSEITGDHSPFGLSLFFRSALLKQHGGKPEDGLRIHSLFEQIREKTKNPHYLSDILTHYLIENPHFVRVEMIPDKELAAKELAEEQLVLTNIHEKMSQENIQEIIEQAKKLNDFQKTQEAESDDILPKITLHDVPKNARHFHLDISKSDSLQIFHHTCFTNEIVYADLTFNLPYIPKEDLYLTRLFTVLAPQMGCGGRNYVDTLEYIQAHTGGIEASLSFNLQASDYHRFYPAFSIRGKALHRKVPFLFPLMQEMASSINFQDHERLREVFQKHYTSLESSLTQNALKYAINLSAKWLSAASKVANEWFGLDYFLKIRQIASNLDTYIPILSEKLTNLGQTIYTNSTPDLILTTDEDIFEVIQNNAFYGIHAGSKKSLASWKADDVYNIVPPQGKIVASPVAFVAKVFSTVSFTHEDAAALNIAAFLFDNLTLHPLIREQGGAYGGGAVSNVLSGNFYFYSYRDPNILRTLKAFDTAAMQISRGKFDESDLEEAKLEMIQALDSPISPGSRGDVAYGWMREGKTLEVRQKFRDKILSLTKADVIQAVNQHILPHIQEGAAVAFASKELLEKENELLEADGLTPLQISSI